ncbi:hypothetical protein PAPYR_12263 [Paratrimastix pyriformis]|uniref:Uncharacterized protein n=1 Tax=Paratrimastix pyriformis TaxID=342808 RepID=A0ABQ8U7H5_9EUKA|nr:hypothetical protein PAPYR_12263 [Paratrimastix pyriformis]
MTYQTMLKKLNNWNNPETMPSIYVTDQSVCADVEKLEPAPATSAAFGSREVTHLYVLLGPLKEAVWRAKKPQIYKGLYKLGFHRIFLQSHQSPAGIMFYLPKENWFGAQCVTRFLGDCSLGVFRVGDPDKFRLCLVDHGSRPRQNFDHPDSDSNSAKEMDFGVAPSSACRSQGLLSPLATPTATATAPPPAPLETPAAPLETAAAPPETPAAPLETPAAPLETAAAPLETPAAPLETAAAPLETAAAPLETAAARLDAASDASSCSSRPRVGRRTMNWILKNDVLKPRTRSGQS